MNRRSAPRTISALAATALVAALGATTTATTTAAAGPAGGDEPTTSAASAARGGSTFHQFTLITGDVATARTDASGALTGAGVRGHDGRDVLSTTLQTEQGLYVFPEGAQELVDAGVVDAELFNLTALLDAGYDDRSVDEIPVILEYAAGRAPRRAAPGIEPGVRLLSIGGGAARVDKQRAAAAWDALRLAAGRGRSRATGPVEAVWLDRKVSATDLGTPTVPLTGAGRAHELGHDGDGVTVAVLDTGYDTGHPDLAGRVVGSQSFVWGDGVEDLNGHGTHVASTVAGTGAASDGRYAGMAPGADLLVGKVLGNNGNGYTSGIIAGMQWAVESGADIVSMSLGSVGRTCAGPDVAAIDALGDEALFVVAAGNAGTAGSISTPGCAAKALTVGAVDRAGDTAGFSSRGPVFGGDAAKPDLASQGVGVVAARAGGRGETAYRALSGTSMATPHVAGGAALLLDARPGLAPARLKALLAPSASDGSRPVLEQGAGPMDAGQAVDQAVSAAPNTRLGSFPYPQRDLPPTAASLTLTNDSADDVELDLALEELVGGDGSTDVPGLVRLGADRTTVPAQGTVEVPLTLHPATELDLGAAGTVTGRLVGTDAAGRRVTVPFSVWLEPASYDVTVTAIDRFGQRATAPSSWSLVDGERSTARGYSLSSGTMRLRVQAGTYSVSANVMTRDEPSNAGPVESVAVMTRQQVRIDGPTDLVFDAREAEPITWRTDQDSEPVGFSLGFEYDLGNGVTRAANLVAAPNYVEEIYGLSSGSDPRYSFVATTRAYAPGVRMATAAGAVEVLPSSLGTGLAGPGGAPLRRSTADDVDGAVVLHEISNVSTLVRDVNALGERGAVAVVVTRPGTVGRLPLVGQYVEVPMYSVPGDTGQRLGEEIDAGGAEVTWTGVGLDRSPYAYNLARRSVGSIETGEEVVRRTELAAERATYHSQGDERKVYTEMMYSLPGLAPTYASGSTHWVAAPRVRTDFYTVEEPLRWTAMVMPNWVNAGSLFDGPRTRQPGLTATSWGRVPAGPARNTTGDGILVRESNRLYLKLPWFGDAAGHDGLGGYGDGRSQQLSVDGVPTNHVGGAYPVPLEPAEVTLTTEWRRPVDRAPISWDTGVSYRTEWTVQTSAADEGTQHLLVPRVDVPVDGANRVPAGEGTRVVVAGIDDATGAAAPLAGARVWFATGTEGVVGQVPDGAWQELRVLETGQGHQVVVPAVPTGGFVHLRVRLTGTDGSSVDQTMVRAYGAR